MFLLKDNLGRIGKSVKRFTFLVCLSLFLPAGFGYHVGMAFVIDRRLLLLLAIATLLMKKSVGTGDHRYRKYFVLYALVASVSVFFAASLSVSVLNLIQFLAFSVVMGILVWEKFDVDDFRYFINALIFTYSCLAVLVISERIAGTTWYYNLFAANINLYNPNYMPGVENLRLGVRAQGPFLHPIFASIEFAAISAMILVRLFFDRKNRLKLEIMLLLNLAAIYSTSSRGGMVSFVAAAMFVFLLTFRIRVSRRAIVSVLAAFILLLAAVPTVRQNLFVLAVGGFFPELLTASQYQKTEAQNLQGRLEDMQIVMRHVGSFGLLGIGQGMMSNNLKAAAVFGGGRLSSLIGVYPYYLTILIDNGVLGLALFLLFLGFCFVKLLKLFRRKVMIISPTALMVLGYLTACLVGWASVNTPLEGFVIFPLLAFVKFEAASRTHDSSALV